MGWYSSWATASVDEWLLISRVCSGRAWTDADARYQMLYNARSKQRVRQTGNDSAFVRWMDEDVALPSLLLAGLYR